MNEITKYDARQAIRKISDAYPLPRDSDPDRLAGLWVTVLEGFTTTHLDAAVMDFLKDGGRFFPKPSEIKAKCFEARSSGMGQSRATLKDEYWEWEQTHEGGCPVCGATLQDLTADQRSDTSLIWGGPDVGLRERTGDDEPPPPRLGIIHDPQQHRIKRIPWVGAPHLENNLLLMDDSEAA